ncbi:hypothetical protein PMAC_000940 [Pneumocystis sp. 'macacae']|nr:hypothetical protein PMAC_000940 [Pneumocystis sp. 'macacae']
MLLQCFWRSCLLLVLCTAKTRTLLAASDFENNSVNNKKDKEYQLYKIDHIDTPEWAHVPVDDTFDTVLGNTLGNILGAENLHTENNNDEDSASIKLTPETFHQKLSRGLWLVEFFSPSCSYCASLKQFWESAAKSALIYSDSYDLHFGEINCLLYRCNYKHGKQDEELILETISESTVNQIFAFIRSKLENKQPITPPDMQKENPNPMHLYTSVNKHGRVETITLNNFTSLVLSGHHGWFIRFYVPSCPYCARMFGDWKRLSASLQGKMNIGDVNCDEEKDLCSKLNINTVPILFYYRGLYSFQYRGPKKYYDLKLFSLKVLLSDIVSDMLHWLSIALIGKAPLLKIANSSAFKNLFPNSQYSSLAVVRDKYILHYPTQNMKTVQDKEALLQWMQNLWLPLFPELTIINIDEVMRKHIVVLVVFYRSEESKRNINLIRSILREWESIRSKVVKNSKNNTYLSSIQFVWVNGVTWKKWLYRKFRLKKTTNEEKVIFYTPIQKRYWSKHTNNSYIRLNKKSVLDFLKVILKYTEKGKPDTSKKSDRSKKGYYIAITIYIITVIILIVCLIFVLKKIKQWRQRKTRINNNGFLVSRFD